jgi:hypothetical protein
VIEYLKHLNFLRRVGTAQLAAESGYEVAVEQIADQCDAPFAEHTPPLKISALLQDTYLIYWGAFKPSPLHINLLVVFDPSDEQPCP